MNILLINSVCGIGSTGRICGELAQRFQAEGHQVKIAYGRDGNVPEQFREFGVRIGSDWDVRCHGLRTRLLDDHGFGSRKVTEEFLRWADGFDPDVLWLHNLHGYYLHVGLLFEWIKGRPQMQVKWTLHDCWAFTGHCSHFAFAGCEKWKTGCEHCPQKFGYPASFLKDACRENFVRKKALFQGVRNMTLIAPSQWLAELAKESFLGEYPVEVCRNSINKAVFRPVESSFRKDHGLEGKRMILGVAGVWTRKKGLEDFKKLAGMLPAGYRIVLVGLTPKQIRQLPGQILGLPRTADAGELAKIYGAADVFFNPTYEDTFPTVNLEAEACGTPVVTYGAGGCPETIVRPDSVAVPVGDLEGALAEMLKILA